ncbi:hypothetical protein D3C78_1540380 [compost metagenome]
MTVPRLLLKIKKLPNTFGEFASTGTPAITSKPYRPYMIASQTRSCSSAKAAKKVAFISAHGTQANVTAMILLGT